MIKKILFIALLAFLQFACTENTNSEENQQQLDSQRKQDAEENKQMIDDHQNKDYNVRRIPAEKEEPRPDDD